LCQTYMAGLSQNVQHAAHREEELKLRSTGDCKITFSSVGMVSRRVERGDLQCRASSKISEGWPIIPGKVFNIGLLRQRVSIDVPVVMLHLFSALRLSRGLQQAFYILEVSNEII
ncbi:hypothetical protein RvY_16712, partial [Ramazzottius varieornatus]